MLKQPITIRELVDLLPAPIIAILTPIFLWALVDYQLRRIRCSFCAAGYAYWRRCNGRACRECRREIDRKLAEAMRYEPYYSSIVQKW